MFGDVYYVVACVVGDVKIIETEYERMFPKKNLSREDKSDPRQCISDFGVGEGESPSNRAYQSLIFTLVCSLMAN